MSPIVRVDMLEKAIEAWAAEYAKAFDEHGRPEGQSPEDWANDALLDAALENEALVKAFGDLAKAKFLIACSVPDRLCVRCPSPVAGTDTNYCSTHMPRIRE